MDSCNFTYKANLHTSEVETDTGKKLCHFGCYVAKAKLFCQKVRPGHPGWSENFIPG